jgi:DNA-binding transcriptional MerR regulator/effector-binding domain-containing protein
MFRIGEFAQIAQVSGRQLRFYDQLGLLRPDHTDPATGYRYFSIRQLPQLNRILALKELGLTLEQIGGLLQNEISAAELRGMLAMKRAQVEQSLRAEEARLRHIESRIQQIDRVGTMQDYDIVVKSVAAQPWLSVRSLCEGMDEAVALLSTVAVEGCRQIKAGLRDKLVVVGRTDFEQEKLDLEVGVSLTRPTNQSVALAGDQVLRAGELPAVETMASVVRSGPGYESHRAFGAIGAWMEANSYAIVGPFREVFLEPLTGPPDMNDALVEIQFPVRRAA